MTRWSVNPEAAINNLQRQLDEIKLFQETGRVNGKTYQTCKVCGELVHKLSNDYSKQGYCSECWLEKKKVELKSLWSSLIGFKITDFEIEVSQYTTDDPRLAKLVLEKDGVEKVLKAEDIVHLII